MELDVVYLDISILVYYQFRDRNDYVKFTIVLNNNMAH